MSHARIRFLLIGRTICLAIWFCFHFLIALQLAGTVPRPPLWFSPGSDPGLQLLQQILTAGDFPVYLLVLAGAFLYVPLVHWMDKRFRCAGVRSMLTHWPAARHARMPDAAQQQRHGLRIQTITIKFGFAATIFVLCVDLYSENSGSQAFLKEKAYILMTMAALFLFATFANLIQLVLYDALFAPGFSSVPENYRARMTATIQTKIRRLRVLSWQFLIAPTILGSILLNPWMAITVNFAYGLLLYHYYFLPRELAVKIINGTRAERVESPAPAEVGAHSTP